MNPELPDDEEEDFDLFEGVEDETLEEDIPEANEDIPEAPLGEIPPTLESAGIDARGHLILGFDDGMSLDAGPALGPRGPKGERGVTGSTGPQGKLGAPGKDGRAVFKGDKGEKGDKGDLGIRGVAGPRGLKGEIGFRGAKGDKGDTGAAGVDGSAGLDGAVGPKGDAGEKGEPGPVGPVGPKPKHKWEGTKLFIEQPDGSWGKPVDLKGPMTQYRGRMQQLGAGGAQSPTVPTPPELFAEDVDPSVDYVALNFKTIPAYPMYKSMRVFIP
ncbi:hypothetical protein [Sphingomonas sp.]|uniref:hypothetical protein n=1 Tax=Sphingomonas sp. TaxID=28214 RepID=UPI003567C352